MEKEIWCRKNFDWEGFKNENIAIHCDTREKAEDLMDFLDRIGVVWATNDRLTDNNCHEWEVHKQDTCYNIDEDDGKLYFADLEYYLEEAKEFDDLDYKIVEWEVDGSGKFWI